MTDLEMQHLWRNLEKVVSVGNVKHNFVRMPPVSCSIFVAQFQSGKPFTFKSRPRTEAYLKFTDGRDTSHSVRNRFIVQYGIPTCPDGDYETFPVTDLEDQLARSGSLSLIGDRREPYFPAMTDEAFERRYKPLAGQRLTRAFKNHSVKSVEIVILRTGDGIHTFLLDTLGQGWPGEFHPHAPKKYTKQQNGDAARSRYSKDRVTRWIRDNVAVPLQDKSVLSQDQLGYQLALAAKYPEAELPPPTRLFT